MKKQKIYKTINRLARVLLSGVFAFLPMLVFVPKASAAVAACYVGTGSSFRTATCEITNPRHVYYDSQGTRLTVLPDDTCYQQDTSVEGAVRYNQNDCGILEAFASGVADTAPDLCTASGGVWTASASPGTQCACPAGNVYSATSRQCLVPGGAAATSSTSNDIPTAAGPEVDCTNADGDLNGENCGIVALLNTAFNFVSGGVALAVIGNIIYAGIQYSTAQGDPSAVNKSKSRIRTALLAFLMYLSLYAFIQWLIPGGVF